MGSSLEESVQGYLCRERKEDRTGDRNGEKEGKWGAEREGRGRAGREEGREKQGGFQYVFIGALHQIESVCIRNNSHSKGIKRDVYSPEVEFEWSGPRRIYLGLLKHCVPMRWQLHAVFIAKGQRRSQDNTLSKHVTGST